MAAARITSLRGHMLGICLKLFQPLFESGREFDFPVCALRTNPYSTVHIGERNQHWPTCVYKLCLLPWLWEGGGSCPRSHEVITYLPIWGSVIYSNFQPSAQLLNSPTSLHRFVGTGFSRTFTHFCFIFTEYFVISLGRF